MRDDSYLRGVVRTDIFGIAEFIGVSTGEHFIDSRDGIMGDLGFVFI